MLGREECFECAWLAMVNAAANFAVERVVDDPSRDVDAAFRHYARYCIHGTLLTEAKKELRRRQRLPTVSHDAVTGWAADAFEGRRDRIDRSLWQEAEDVMSRLPKTARHLLELRSLREMPYREIAEALGVSRQWACVQHALAVKAARRIAEIV